MDGWWTGENHTNIIQHKNFKLYFIIIELQNCVVTFLSFFAYSLGRLHYLACVILFYEIYIKMMHIENDDSVVFCFCFGPRTDLMHTAMSMMFHRVE